VLRTRVGYAGGVKRDPTYDNMGDHTEVVEVLFDSAQISYEKLLEVFWSAHNPAGRIWSRQYRNVILYVGERQKELAEFSLKTIQDRLGTPVKSQIEHLDTFYPAERYHQKYSLRRHGRLFNELVRQFGSEEAALDSTLAARINGHLGGYGGRKDLEKNLEKSGLSVEGRQRLKKSIEGRLR